MCSKAIGSFVFSCAIWKPMLRMDAVRLCYDAGTLQ